MAKDSWLGFLASKPVLVRTYTALALSRDADVLGVRGVLGSGSRSRRMSTNFKELARAVVIVGWGADVEVDVEVHVNADVEVAFSSVLVASRLEAV